MKKILQLGRYFPPDDGGIETVMYEIAEGLNSNGVSCDVLCSNNKNKTQISRFSNYKVIRAASFGQILSTSIAPMLIYLLWRINKKYDIVHLHHPDPLAAIAVLICCPKKNIVLHWHSDIIRQKFSFTLYRPFQILLLRRSSKIIVTSSNYLGGSKHLNRYKQKVEVVPIGIKGTFQVNNFLLSGLKEKYRGKHIVFTLGRHVSYKGFDYLIEAASYLDESFIILIGGNGKLSKLFMKKIQTLGLNAKVKLIGKLPQTDLGTFFHFCSIFCLPSIERTEAFGVVLLEAMSFGKPLVTTNIPGSGVNWVNQNEITGLSVAPRCPKELADAIIKISCDKKLRDLFGEQSRLRFEKYFSRNVMVNNLIELYNTL